MNPRPGPRRPIVGVRIHQDAINLLDRWATDDGITRSELIRRLLTDAVNRETQRRGERR